MKDNYERRLKMSKEYLDYEGLSHYTDLFKTYISDTQPKVFYDTTENWSKQTSLESIRGAIYIYTDYQKKDGADIPGIKIGDGMAYVVDLPFVGQLYTDHLNDTVVHITSLERFLWNNKVTCFLDNQDMEKLVFTKD